MTQLGNLGLKTMGQYSNLSREGYYENKYFKAKIYTWNKILKPSMWDYINLYFPPVEYAKSISMLVSYILPRMHDMLHRKQQK